MLAPAAHCSVALCDAGPSAGLCPHSGQPLCRGHLRREQRRVQALGAAAQRALAAATNSYPELRRHSSRQEVDLVELAEQFQLLKARHQYWRQRICSAARDELNQLEARIRALGDAAEFAQTAKVAAEAGNWRLMFQLVDQIGDSIAYLAECETPAREAESRRAADSLASTRAASAALTAGLNNLRAEPPQSLGPVPGGGRVWRIAVCDNTAGHWVNADASREGESGRVVRARAAPTASGSWRRLAPVCVAVAFHADDKPDHLALLALKGGCEVGNDGSGPPAVGRLRPSIRWQSQVHSLRCDSRDQLLYLTQGRGGLSILDLTGRLRRRLSPQMLGLPARARLTGLCLPPGGKRLYALSYAEQRLVVVGRVAPWPTLALLDVSGCYSPAFFTESLAWCRRSRRLLITDWGGQAVRRLDVETGQAVATLTGGDGDGDATVAFRSPYDVLADRRGRLYIADLASRVIRLLDPDGRRCLCEFSVGLDETPVGKVDNSAVMGIDDSEDEGEVDVRGSAGPVSIDLWEGDSGSRWDWLLVANSNWRQIQVHRVAKTTENNNGSGAM